MIKAKLMQTKALITNQDDAKQIFEEKYYGKYNDEEQLELSLVETYHLATRDLIEIKHKGETLSKEECLQTFSERDEEFHQKYKVYEDLRHRGYIVKTGFKFGAHFRTYPRGVNPYQEGPKKQSEHTKWVVNAVNENKSVSFQDMSRAVRLAQNIRAKMVWGIVDSESEVTYYEVDHLSP